MGRHRMFRSDTRSDSAERRSAKRHFIEEIWEFAYEGKHRARLVHSRNELPSRR